ncbi:MAG TPA: hypothetical protein VFF14_00525 [Candidatus Deferrimicrobium sp.]|nr:hypothetical protein [Candidatus Deferrimicrobium sp.]
MDINLQIQKDGSAQSKFSIPSLKQQKELPFTKELVATMKQAGLTINGNPAEGYTVIGRGINELQKLAEKMPEVPGFPAFLAFGRAYHFERSFWSTTYTMDWRFPWEQEQKNKLVGLVEPSEITLSVHLPVKPESHNAMSVSQDGSTLFWRFTQTGPNEVHFLAKRTNWESIFVCVGLSLGIIIIFLAKIIKLRNYIYKWSGVHKKI